MSRMELSTPSYPLLHYNLLCLSLLLFLLAQLHANDENQKLINFPSFFASSQKNTTKKIKKRPPSRRVIFSLFSCLSRTPFPVVFCSSSPELRGKQKKNTPWLREEMLQ